jgi:hypothetical protein
MHLETASWNTSFHPCSALEKNLAIQELEYHSIFGPVNQNGCIILCVGNLADEKF